MRRLKNKVAIVTGGGRGIGKAIVEKFVNEGAKVYVLDFVLPENIDEFKINNEDKVNIGLIQTDVTNEDSVTNAVKQIESSEKTIDILVNNAGITRDNLLMRMSTEHWDAVINTNLKGAFLMTKAVCRKMMSQHYGRIINIGSIVGSIGNAGQANYSASKAGMIGLTKSLAKEFGSRNILVNLIAPGYVITPMTEKLSDEQKQAYLDNIPLKRGALPEDIANAVMFFASEESSYVTGQILHVDGGLAL